MDDLPLSLLCTIPLTRFHCFNLRSAYLYILWPICIC